MNEQIRQLKQIKSDEELNSQLKYLETEIARIYKIEFEKSYSSMEKSKSGIEMLKDMEIMLEKAINDVSKLRAKGEDFDEIEKKAIEEFKGR